MKRLIMPILMLFIFLLFIPFISIIGRNNSDSKLSEFSSEPSSSKSSSDSPKDNNTSVDTANSVILLDRATGNKLTLSMYDYVCGAVISEMPVSYDLEALKAQALCCKTLAYRQRQNVQNGNDLQLDGAYLEMDSSINYGYVDMESAKQSWGENAEENEKKIRSAVDEIIDKLITYDGEAILPAYHAISSGTTEKASTWWGEDIPYLQSVDSSLDEQADNFETSVTLSKNELISMLSAQYSDITLPQNPEEWISIDSVSQSGNVTVMSVAGQIMNGSRFRTLTGLRSACFEATPNEDSITLTVKGYGHGVGMSQYGAGAMAANGDSYEDIIKHYYSEVEIVEDVQ